jgi:DNA-binding XRE family transcriptional regulator
MIDQMQAPLLQLTATMLCNNRQTESKGLDFRVLDILTDGECPVSNEDFAARLRQLRKQKNLSQADLAKIVGVHYNHIGRYERGSSRPSAEADFEDRDLLRMFQEIQKLDQEDKRVVKKLIEAFVVKKQVAAIAARD